MDDDFREHIAPWAAQFPDRLRLEAFNLDNFRNVASWVASRAFGVDDYYGTYSLPASSRPALPRLAPPRPAPPRPCPPCPTLILSALLHSSLRSDLLVAQYYIALPHFGAHRRRSSELKLWSIAGMSLVPLADAFNHKAAYVQLTDDYAVEGASSSDEDAGSESSSEGGDDTGVVEESGEGDDEVEEEGDDEDGEGDDASSDGATGG